MLERRRATRNYHIVPGDDDHDHDLELGDAVRHEDPQESGVISASSMLSVTEELDNWDENAEDWDDDTGDTKKVQDVATANASVEDETTESKKRSD